MPLKPGGEILHNIYFLKWLSLLHQMFDKENVLRFGINIKKIQRLVRDSHAIKCMTCLRLEHDDVTVNLTFHFWNIKSFYQLNI